MKKRVQPRIEQLGERAILISWEEIIDEKLFNFILRVSKSIRENRSKEILEINNTYNSLIISYHVTINKFYDEKSRLNKIISTTNKSESLPLHIYTLPVCYNEEFGWDLEEVSHKKELSKTEIIDLHTSPIYTVYFTGFLPGFLYLGGLNDSLKIPRKNSPRLKVKKGAVGLAENQTGIYPQESAGGWQIIGNCPIDFFNSSKNPPSPFRPGDKIKFRSVGKDERLEISKKVKSGSYKLISEIYKL